MKQTLLLLIAVCMLFGSFATEACTAEEKTYLVQMINQLEAMKSLVLAAAKAQQKNLRTPFHYTSFRGANGKLHNGLLEDINEIEKGIAANLNSVSKEPRQFEAIKGDYVSDKP